VMATQVSPGLHPTNQRDKRTILDEVLHLSQQTSLSHRHSGNLNSGLSRLHNCLARIRRQFVVYFRLHRRKCPRNDGGMARQNAANRDSEDRATTLVSAPLTCLQQTRSQNRFGSPAITARKEKFSRRGVYV